MEVSKTPRTNSIRRAESMAAVKGAACQLFVRRGFRSTSMDMIAQKVGLTKGAIYFYFKDKDSLLIDILADSRRLFFDHLFDDIGQLAHSPAAQVDLFLNRIVRAGGEVDSDLLLLPVAVSMEQKDKPGPITETISGIYEGLYSELERIIDAGQKAGEFASSSTARSLAAIIVSMMDGLIMELHRNSSGLEGWDLARAASAAVSAILGQRGYQ